MRRRDFVKLGCGSLFTYSISKNGLFEIAKADTNTSINVSDPNPIQLLSWNQFSSLDFNGDDSDRSHEALWNREGYIANKGGIPPASEFTDTVIIGGGMSGLLTGYFLKHRKPIILEQARNFGGNSRGESFAGRRSNLL